MDALSGGAEEVEQTLRFARLTTEREIATYRIWVFGFLCAAATLLRFRAGPLSVFCVA